MGGTGRWPRHPSRALQWRRIWMRTRRTRRKRDCRSRRWGCGRYSLSAPGCYLLVLGGGLCLPRSQKRDLGRPEFSRGEARPLSVESSSARQKLKGPRPLRLRTFRLLRRTACELHTRQLRCLCLGVEADAVVLLVVGENSAHEDVECF